MLRRTLLALLAFASVAFVACSGGDDSAESPSATLATTPVTDAEPTTTTRQLTFEEQVEAAYLKSWEIYTEAVLTFDTTRLSEVFVGDALELRTGEVARLRDANTPARVDIDHDYEIQIADGETAIVRDDYFNRSVLLDGATGEPIEPTPNEVVRREYHLRRVEGTWKVSFATGR